MGNIEKPENLISLEGIDSEVLPVLEAIFTRYRENKLMIEVDIVISDFINNDMGCCLGCLCRRCIASSGDLIAWYYSSDPNPFE